MIYLLSDIHGKMDFAGMNEYLNAGNPDDLLIVLGDMELNFADTEENREFTKRFLSINKNIAFLDGNHDNFGYLNGFPEEEWNGGVVNRLTENIFHLKRGNIYNIEGISFFVFGGCKSSPKWKEMGLWYDGEEPGDDELMLAYQNLEKHGRKVDYILTHKYEEKIIRGTPSEKLIELTRFLDENVQYKKWYAGHWHKETAVDEKHILVYDKLTPVLE